MKEKLWQVCLGVLVIAAAVILTYITIRVALLLVQPDLPISPKSQDSIAAGLFPR